MDNGSVMEESSQSRNSYLTRTLLKVVADFERLNKNKQTSHFRSNFKADSHLRACNNKGKYSSVANPRCCTFSPANYRTNGTVSSSSGSSAFSSANRSANRKESVSSSSGSPAFSSANCSANRTESLSSSSGSPAFSSANRSANRTESVSSVNDRHSFHPANNKTNGIVSTVNDRSLLIDKSRSGEFEMPTPLTRGPRGRYNGFPLQSSTTKNDFAIPICRDKYNLPDFQTEYEAAKFYVIKSFNEDDVHKSIKYDVWTSTSYGNNKLNNAFHCAEAKSMQTGTKCPIFLFFSVNASRQFVGVAEMLGPVDFNKDMKFWKLFKYNGFFPIRWHIIKDVPNTQFNHIHIFLENKYRAVTYTRDTQEIGLKQGLEMLNIFKSYSAKTSLLDDFDFYENREKLLNSDKRSKAIGESEQYGTKPKFTIPEPRVYGYDSYQQNTAKAGERKIGRQSSGSKEDNVVFLTKQLSLNSSAKNKSSNS